MRIAVTSACGRGSTVGRYNGHGSVLPIHVPASPGAALGCESVMSVCTRATQWMYSSGRIGFIKDTLDKYNSRYGPTSTHRSLWLWIQKLPKKKDGARGEGAAGRRSLKGVKNWGGGAPIVKYSCAGCSDQCGDELSIEKIRQCSSFPICVFWRARSNCRHQNVRNPAVIGAVEVGGHRPRTVGTDIVKMLAESIRLNEGQFPQCISYYYVFKWGHTWCCVSCA